MFSESISFYLAAHETIQQNTSCASKAQTRRSSRLRNTTTCHESHPCSLPERRAHYFFFFFSNAAASLPLQQNGMGGTSVES